MIKLATLKQKIKKTRMKKLLLILLCLTLLFSCEDNKQKEKNTSTKDNLIKVFQPPNNWVDADLKSLDHPVEFMDAQAYLLTQLDEIAQKNNYKTLNKGSKLYNEAVVILETLKMVRDAQYKWSSTVDINDRKKYNKDIKKSHSAKIANNIFEKDREIFEDWIDLNRELFEKFYQLN